VAPDHTGPSSAKNALVLIYDVFGFKPQLLQGADLLAYGKDGKKFQVFIPDFLPEKASPSWFEPDVTLEERAAMGRMFGPGGSANAGVMKTALEKVSDAIKTQHPVEKLGVLGYCWGAKVSPLLLLQQNKCFKIDVTIDCVLERYRRYLFHRGWRGPPFGHGSKRCGCYQDPHHRPCVRR
jgi:dienelactone hydrolase